MYSTMNYEAVLSMHQKDKTGERHNINYVVFIVEDSFPNRLLLEKYLSRLPNADHKNKPHLEIYSFETAEECLSSEIRPDIVIIDHYLSEDKDEGMTGLELMRSLAKVNPNTKFIIMSGQDEVLLTAVYYDEGAFTYIVKNESATSRIEQAILKIIKNDQKQRKVKRRRAWWFVISVLLGLIFLLIWLE